MYHHMNNSVYYYLYVFNTKWDTDTEYLQI